MTPCEICGKHPATLHIKSVVNGEKSEMNVCASCARERHAGFAQAFDIGQLLAGFMRDGAEKPARGEVCPGCGMDYAQFRKGGLFGCADCYATFSDHLEPLLNRIHGRVRHVGKLPARAGGGLRVRREIERLSEQMRRAVADEKFEEAAQLRDRIRELQTAATDPQNAKGADSSC